MFQDLELDLIVVAEGEFVAHARKLVGYALVSGVVLTSQRTGSSLL